MRNWPCGPISLWQKGSTDPNLPQHLKPPDPSSLLCCQSSKSIPRLQNHALVPAAGGFRVKTRQRMVQIVRPRFERRNHGYGGSFGRHIIAEAGVKTATRLLLPDRDAGGSAPRSIYRPPVGWETRLVVLYAAAIHRRVVLTMVLFALASLPIAASLIGLALLAARIDRGLGAVTVVAGAPVVLALVAAGLLRLHKRTTISAATPADIQALRRQGRPGTCAHVRDSAARQRERMPGLPITIMTVLRWQDDAAGGRYRTSCRRSPSGPPSTPRHGRSNKGHDRCRKSDRGFYWQSLCRRSSMTGSPTSIECPASSSSSMPPRWRR